MNGAACFNVDYLKTRTGTAQDAEGEYLQVISTRFACLTGLHPSLTLAGPLCRSRMRPASLNVYALASDQALLHFLLST